MLGARTEVIRWKHDMTFHVCTAMHHSAYTVEFGERAMGKGLVRVDGRLKE